MLLETDNQRAARMCILNTPRQDSPTLPKETAATKSPDAAAVRESTGTRVTNSLRSQTPTILTSSQGVMDFAKTDKKTLLGQ